MVTEGWDVLLTNWQVWTAPKEYLEVLQQLWGTYEDWRSRQPWSILPPARWASCRPLPETLPSCRVLVSVPRKSSCDNILVNWVAGVLCQNSQPQPPGQRTSTSATNTGPEQQYTIYGPPAACPTVSAIVACLVIHILEEIGLPWTKTQGWS